jgi:uncharacterized membrane protein (UPF0127 family)
MFLADIFTLIATAWILYIVINADNSLERVKQLTVNDKLQDSSKINQLQTMMNKKIGLLNHTSLAAGEGLWFKGSIIPLRKVHMNGMLINIEILYLNRAGVVLKCIEAKPNQNDLPSPKGTFQILEMGTGSLEKYSISIGSKLALV